MDKMKAVRYWRQGAERFAPAQYALAFLYYQGDLGVDRDLEEALRYFELAAAQGHFSKSKSQFSKTKSAVAFAKNRWLRLAFSFEIFIGGFNGHPATKFA